MAQDPNDRPVILNRTLKYDESKASLKTSKKVTEKAFR
jgi:hypothetical protein